MAGTIAGRPALEAVLKNVTDKNVRRVSRVLDGLRTEKIENIPQAYQSAIRNLAGSNNPTTIINQAVKIVQQRNLKKS